MTNIAAQIGERNKNLAGIANAIVKTTITQACRRRHQRLSFGHVGKR